MNDNNRRAVALLVAGGLTVLLSGCSGQSATPTDSTPAAIKDKLVAAGLTCGDDSIAEATGDDGDAYSTVECYSDAGWYQVDVWDSAEGLRTWWAARCENQSSDVESRAVGAYWTTDIQTPEEAQTIADALGGKVKTNKEWCAAPDDIGT